MEDYNGSDHQYITFEVGIGPRSVSRDKPGKWNLKKLDVERFSEELKKGGHQTARRTGMDGRSAAEELVSSTMGLIFSACEASMPRSKPRHGKPSAFWWTSEIANVRRKCLELRRKAQRAINRDEASCISEEHRQAKKQLRRAINQSKARCWKILIEDIDGDPWGLGYKIVTQKLGAQKPTRTMNASTTERIVRFLFPSHPERSALNHGPDTEVPLFSGNELERAILSLKNKKAPGPDGIPNEVPKIVYQQDSPMLLGMYNLCLSEGVFSHRWKVARLLLSYWLARVKVTQSFSRPIDHCACLTQRVRLWRN